MVSKNKATKSQGKEFQFSEGLQKKLERLISDPVQSKMEGIRGKVFTDRYSLKDAEGKSIEEFPEQMWTRVAAGLAQVEKTPELQEEWTKKFYSALKDFKYVPGGRVLSGGHGFIGELRCCNWTPGWYDQPFGGGLPRNA